MIDSEDEESCSSYSDEDEEDEVFPQLKPSRYSSYTGVRQQSTLAGADEDGGEEDDEEEEEEDQESAEDTLREEMIRKLTQVLVSRLPQEGIPHMQYADVSKRVGAYIIPMTLSIAQPLFVCRPCVCLLIQSAFGKCSLGTSGRLWSRQCPESLS